MKNIYFALSLLMLLCITPSFAQSGYQIVNNIHVDGTGGWDYLTIDEATSRLYVSHGNETNVIDVTTGKLIETVSDTKGVHGITLAKDLGKGFISNGRDTSVTVIDLKTSKSIARIKVTGLNLDAILYDPFSHKVFTFNGRSSNSTVIDAVSNNVIGTIALAGKPEFAVSNLEGKIFVNIEDKNSISVINANTLEVEQIWSIAPGESPSGLAIDRENHRLFSVCENKIMVVTNYDNGKVVTTLKIGEGSDGVAFDPILKRAYSSNGEGTLTVVQEKDANTFTVLENIPTQKGARTITVNSKTHKLYLPTAEYNKVPASTTQNSRPRATIKPGSFKILEVGLK